MKQIHQYVRKGDRLIGTLVGIKHEDSIVRITASKCNTSHGDRFDKKIGLEIAHNRSKKSGTVIAHSMLPDMIKFMNRCSKYFDVNPTDIECPVSTELEVDDLPRLDDLMGNLDIIGQPRR